jgi:hypothetical protein
MTKAQGGTTDTALDWISAHSDDADFNEELRIMGVSNEGGSGKPKSNMTKEERMQKAREL